ncbi:MAG: hypothetical protein HYY68_00145 [Thaumarchaeota archaeon]|nr:hypothetical protein [Nitrososphaerota archaeon]
MTFTRLNATRPGFPKPLTLAIAEFENGVKVLAKLDGGEASIGMKVMISEDLATPGFKFVPAE